jgi:class 3 adenylate cyclase/tetratricopeptide (TPR) repeat protein
VSVLFADLKASMEMLEGRDPEEARRLLDPVLERMMEAVHHYEGIVNQVMGDGVMALFGAPLAQEDHAIRACHAALRMHASVKGYADEVRNESPVPIRVRIGLNSGEVVVRSIASDLRMDYTAVGHTTNLAARMEQEAPPGKTLMTANTVSLVEGYVSALRLGPRPIKGMSAPVDVYELTGMSGARSRFDAATARGLSRFVGRDREIAELSQALGRASLGQGQVLAVIGEPGVGKSRLFWEFTQSLGAERCLMLKCGSVSYARASAFFHVAELLRIYFGIEEVADEREIRRNMSARLAAHGMLQSPPAFSAFLWLMDIPADDPDWEALDPTQRRQRALDCVVQLMLRQAEVQPLLLVVENLHWIDAETQIFLDLLVDRIHTARILLLVNFRPEYAHRWSGKSHFREFRIGELGASGAGALLDALLGSHQSLKRLRELFIERAEGNPLFLEECVRSLVETRSVVGEPGDFRLEVPVQEMRVPATVQAILAARIDRLPSAQKRVLQAASVVGKRVPLRLLQEISERDGSTLRGLMKRLQDAEFLYETSVLPEVEFTFKHALTQEVAYGTLLKDKRRALHILIMEGIERLHGDRLSEQTDRLAHHAYNGELWGKAADYFLHAGRKSIARSAYAEGLGHLSAGLDAAERLPATADRRNTELDLQVSVGSALLATRGWAAPEVERTYTTALTLCDAVGHTPRIFPVLWGIATFFLIRSRIERAVVAATRFLDLAGHAEDDGARLVGEFLMGNTLFWTGALSQTRMHVETSIARYDPARHDRLADFYGQDIRMSALTYLAWTLWYQGYPDQALRYHDEAVRVAEERKHAHSIAYADGARLFGLQLRGAVDTLLDRAAASIAFTEENGLGFWSAFDRVLQAWAVARRDASRAAIGELRNALESYRATGAELPGVAFRSMLADACLRAGDADGAMSEVALAMHAVESLKDRIWEPEVYRLKGECLLALGPGAGEEAESCFRKAISVASDRGAKSWELRATISLGRLLRNRGERREAGRTLAAVYESFTEGFDTLDLRDARELLSRPL